MRDEGDPRRVCDVCSTSYSRIRADGSCCKLHASRKSPPACVVHDTFCYRAWNVQFETATNQCGMLIFIEVRMRNRQFYVPVRSAHAQLEFVFSRWMYGENPALTISFVYTTQSCSWKKIMEILLSSVIARNISFLSITIRVSHTNVDTVEISAICITLEYRYTTESCRLQYSVLRATRMVPTGTTEV